MDLSEDIQTLIFTYSTEPIYVFPRWVPVQVLDILYSEALENPRCVRWIKKNFSRIYNKSQLIKNPHPSVIKLVGQMILTNDLLYNLVITSNQYPNYKHVQKFEHRLTSDILENCPDINFIKEHCLTHRNKDYLAKNIHGEPLKYYLKLLSELDITKFPLLELAANTNPIAIDFIAGLLSKNILPDEKIKRIFDKLILNPSAIPILEKYPKYINHEIYNNPSPKVFELLLTYNTTHNTIKWPEICKIPEAIDYIKANWELGARTMANEIAETDYASDDEIPEPEKVLYEELLKNPRCFEIIDEPMIDSIKKFNVLDKLNYNSGPQLIHWLGSHRDFIEYPNMPKQHSNYDLINADFLAKYNPYFLSDIYGKRLVKKLSKILI